VTKVVALVRRAVQKQCLDAEEAQTRNVGYLAEPGTSLTRENKLKSKETKHVQEEDRRPKVVCTESWTKKSKKLQTGQEGLDQKEVL